MACDLIKIRITELKAHFRINFKKIFSHVCQNAGKWSAIKSTSVTYEVM